MIPDEAIEAARLKLEDVLGGWFDDTDAIRQILEAAAPHMHVTLLAELADRDEKLAKVRALADELMTYYNDFGVKYSDLANIRAAVAAANGGGE